MPSKKTGFRMQQASRCKPFVGRNSESTKLVPKAGSSGSMQNRKVIRSAPVTGSKRKLVAEIVDVKLTHKTALKKFKGKAGLTKKEESPTYECIDISDDEISVAELAEIILSNDEISAAEVVFSNDYLLEPIFKWLRIADLKSVRQVNRLWNFEATKVLRKRRMLPIYVDDAKSKVMILPNQDRSSELPLPSPLPLEQFCQLIYQSAIFPCGTFEIRFIQKLALEGDFSTFFTTHGDLVHVIEIDFAKSSLIEKGQVAVETLFGKHFPNLEVLAISSCKVDPQTKQMLAVSNTSFTELKKLKSLHCESNVPIEIIKRILKISPNLRSIYWDLENVTSKISYYERLIDVDAVQLLKNIYFNFTNCSVDFYEKMLNHTSACEKLEEIKEIYFHPDLSPKNSQKASEVLAEFVRRSSNTLKIVSDLHCMDPSICFEFFQFPKAVEAEVICNRSTFLGDETRPAIFVPGGNFSNVFPNLRRLDIQVYLSEDEGLNMELFPEPLIPMLTVNELRIDIGKNNLESLPMTWLQQLCTLFPNVTQASFPVLFESSLELVCCLLGRLEDLTFSFVIDVKDANHHRKLDAALTGFCEETIRDLYWQAPKPPHSLKMALAVSDAKALTVKPALPNLENLKGVSITFVDPDDLGRSGFCGKSCKNVVFDRSSDNKMRNFLTVNKNIIMSHVAISVLAGMCPQWRITYRGRTKRSADY